MTHLLLTFILFFSACSPTRLENKGAKTNAGLDTAQVLIVYLSRTNNTKAVAEMIHDEVGGTLVALELENPALPLFRI